MWLTHKVKISTSSVAIGPCIHHYKNGSPSNLSAKRRIKGMGRRFRIWMMTHLGYDNPTSLQVSFPQKVSFTQITLQAVLRQSLRLPRNEPTLERPAAEHPLKGEPQPRVHRIPQTPWCRLSGQHCDSAHISKQTRSWLATRPSGRFEFTFTANPRLLAQSHRGLLLQVCPLGLASHPGGIQTGAQGAHHDRYRGCQSQCHPHMVLQAR
jgi:hypothetical protein